MPKLKNIILAIKDQGPPHRFWRNLLNGNLLGLFHERSHVTITGKLKVMYHTQESAERAALVMKKMYGPYFAHYKCVFCDGYHIGKNQVLNDD